MLVSQVYPVCAIVLSSLKQAQLGAVWILVFSGPFGLNTTQFL